MVVEPVTISLVALEFIVRQVFAALANKSTNAVWDKLKGDPSRKAFEQALGRAVERYTLGDRLALAASLLGRNGVLAQQDVAAELAELVRFEREPDVALIAGRWATALDHLGESRDIDAEVGSLLELLRQELRATDAFRPVFDAKALDAIAAETEVSAGSLAAIESHLAALAGLLDDRFGELARAFARAPGSVRADVRDFSGLIAEKTQGFVGRRFVFEAIDEFIESRGCGYFVIRGDPGIGKSAIMAELVKRGGYVHHFNVRAEGISRSDSFLRSVCAQLIAKYGLPYEVLPTDATTDSGFFKSLLEDIALSLPNGDRLVIVVDALDEVDITSAAAGANVLYLPLVVPERVYLILSMRRVELPLRVECERATFDLDAASAANQADVAEFLHRRVAGPELSNYVTAHELNEATFVEEMLRRSEGSFIYLRHVLVEMERGKYSDVGIEHLPTGLISYYEDHWRTMRGMNEEAWFAYRLPVLVALTVAEKPVSADLIARFASVDSLARVRSVLRDWAQFLHEAHVEMDRRAGTVYSIYHSSYSEFVAAKEEVADERINLQDARDSIADPLWNELFN